MTDVLTWDESLDLATRLVFHLPGKHNQKTHAKGLNKVGAVNMRRVKPDKVLMSSKLAEIGWDPDDPATKDLRESAALYGFKMVTPLRSTTGVSMSSTAAMLDSETLMVGHKDIWGDKPNAPVGQNGGFRTAELKRKGMDPDTTSMISNVIAHEAGHRWNVLSDKKKTHTNRNDRLNKPLADFANRNGAKRPGGGEWTPDDFGPDREHESLKSIAGGFGGGKFGISDYGYTSREELLAESFSAHQHGARTEIVDLFASTLGWDE